MNLNFAHHLKKIIGHFIMTQIRIKTKSHTEIGEAKYSIGCVVRCVQKEFLYLVTRKREKKGFKIRIQLRIQVRMKISLRLSVTKI